MSTPVMDYERRVEKALSWSDVTSAGLAQKWEYVHSTHTNQRPYDCD